MQRWRAAMPENISAAIALFITTAATVLLMWGSSKWGKRNADDDRPRKRHRRIDDDA